MSSGTRSAKEAWMGLIASMTVDELQQLLTRYEETVWVDRFLARVLPGLDFLAQRRRSRANKRSK